MIAIHGILFGFTFFMFVTSIVLMKLFLDSQKETLDDFVTKKDEAKKEIAEIVQTINDSHTNVVTQLDKLTRGQQEQSQAINLISGRRN